MRGNLPGKLALGLSSNIFKYFKIEGKDNSCNWN